MALVRDSRIPPSDRTLCCGLCFADGPQPEDPFSCCGSGRRCESLFLAWFHLVIIVPLGVFYIYRMMIELSGNGGNDPSEAQMNLAVVAPVILVLATSTILLLIGVYKGKPNYLLPFLCSYPLLVIITFVYVINLVEEEAERDGTTRHVRVGVILAFGVRVLFTIFRHRQELDKNNNGHEVLRDIV